MSDILLHARAQASLSVRVLFFGRVGDRLDRAIRRFLPPQGCSISELTALPVGQRPEVREPIGEIGVRWSVDRDIVGEEAWVRPGQEVAFFSMFSGG